MDGTLVTCSRNLLMRVWDVPTGECKRSWKAHRSPVLCAAFEPSGTLVATGGSDRAVFVWDADNGYATHSFKGHDALVTVVAFLPHPHSVSRLASGGENGQVRVWDLVTQSCVAVLGEHFSAVTSIAFSPDPHGYTMITAGRDSMINLWDTRDLDSAASSGSGNALTLPSAAAGGNKPEVRAQVPTHEAVEAVVVLPTSAADDDSSSSSASASTSSSSASGTSASGNDFLFFTAGEKGLLRKWRLQVVPGKDGKPGSRRYIVGTVAARTVPQIRAASAETVAVVPAAARDNGNSNSSSSSSAVAGDGQPQDTPTLAAEISSKALAVTADAVPVAGQFGALLLRKAPQPAAGTVTAAAASDADGSASNSSNSAKKSSKRKRPADSDATSAPPAAPQYELMTVTRDQVLTWLTADRLRHVKTVVGHSDEIVDVSYLPPPLPLPGDVSAIPLHPLHSKQLVAVATNSEQLRLMDVETFSTTLCDGHAGIILSVAASPDGTLVATASKDNTARIWDVATGTCIAVCEGHTEAVTAVSWPVKPTNFLHAVPSSDSTGTAKAAVLGTSGWVATASKDRTLKIWQLSGLLSQLPSPRPGGWSRAQLRRILSSSSSSSTSHGSNSSPWDVPAPARPRTLAAAVAHEKDVNAVAVSPNDRLIATGSQDKTIKLWTAPDLLPVATLSGHRRGVWSVAFSPTDQVLASASGDRTIRLWSVARGSGYACIRTLEGHDASVLAARFLPSGTQLMSSGADGLLKLWTLTDGECVNTFEGHADKVGALAVRPLAASSAAAPSESVSSSAGAAGDEGEEEQSRQLEQQQQSPLGEIITGGGDSLLAVWRDVTSSEAAAEIQAAEEAVAKQQSLYTAMALRDYPGAISLALELEQPGRAGDILQELLEMGPRPALAGLSTSQLDEKNKAEMLQELREMQLEEEGVTSSSGTSSSSAVSSSSPAQRGEELLATILRSKLPPHLLGRLLSYVREWNTQSRHGMLAQRLLHLLLRHLPRSKLLSALVALREEQGATKMLPGVGAVRIKQHSASGADSGDDKAAAAASAAQAELRSLVTSLLPYSERHADRLDRLQLSAYLADYTLDSMTVLTPEQAGLSGEEAAAMTAGLDRSSSSSSDMRAVVESDDDDSDSSGSEDGHDDEEGGSSLDKSRVVASGGGWGALGRSSNYSSSSSASAASAAPKASSGSSSSKRKGPASSSDSVAAAGKAAAACGKGKRSAGK